MVLIDGGLEEISGTAALIFKRLAAVFRTPELLGAVSKAGFNPTAPTGRMIREIFETTAAIHGNRAPPDGGTEAIWRATEITFWQPKLADPLMPLKRKMAV